MDKALKQSLEIFKAGAPPEDSGPDSSDLGNGRGGPVGFR
jgi:hypothetical protein